MNNEPELIRDDRKSVWEKPLILDYGNINELTKGGEGATAEGVGGSFDPV